MGRLKKFILMMSAVIVLGTAVTLLNLQLYPVEETEPFEGIRSWTEETYPYHEDRQVQKEIDIIGLIEAAQMEALLQEQSVETDGASPLMVLQEDSRVAAEYYARLEERSAELEKQAAAAKKDTVAKQQQVAESAWEFWDDELNVVYQQLRDYLTWDEFVELRDQERAWLRSRDAAANQAVREVNHSSNSVQSLAYTTSLAQWTKERVYELAAMYYGPERP